MSAICLVQTTKGGEGIDLLPCITEVQYGGHLIGYIEKYNDKNSLFLAYVLTVIPGRCCIGQFTDMKNATNAMLDYKNVPV